MDTPKTTEPGGNASNPAPGHHEQQPGKGLLDEKAEKLFREAGAHEDMPDAQEDQEAIDQMKGEEG
ncbi:hypothetical protein MKQ70_04300 [Chitinophaga sedimenti]|uniref:hypothetical protein n=1 Tax=Chitinophaga sedimenti TaxID=2033606 RepID=UPI00200671EE|nr:hypothetical protein [Chitinophaga sedimenti]MCK7554271.1 hypothetical protein [Chitinophaga sedimenti]